MNNTTFMKLLEQSHPTKTFTFSLFTMYLMTRREYFMIIGHPSQEFYSTTQIEEMSF